MKILHTADWHIGKKLHNRSLLEEQEQALEQVLDRARTWKPDVCLIAGDLYDRSVPPVEAVVLVNKVLTYLVKTLKIPTVVIAGNHDNPDRVAFGHELLRKENLYMVGSMEDILRPIVIEDEYGPVEIYAVPYLEPAIVANWLEDSSIHVQEDAMEAVIKRIQDSWNIKERHLLVAHAFLSGISREEVSDSVRPLSIGGSEVVDVEIFKDFDYVALGHLHQNMKVKYEHIRYAGSIYKYSFSEATHKKAVTCVTMDDNGQIDLDIHRLKPTRDVRVIKGAMDQLMTPEVYEQASTNDYVMATLVGQGEWVDPMQTMRHIYPNLLRVERERNTSMEENQKTSADIDFKEKAPELLFEEFYETMNQEPMSDHQKEWLKTVIQDVEKERRRH